MITYPIHLVRTYHIGMQIPCLEFPSNYEVTFDRLNTHCKININIRSKNHIKFSKSFIGYTEISLMAELGGYIMGLLLGDFIDGYQFNYELHY